MRLLIPLVVLAAAVLLAGPLCAETGVAPLPEPVSGTEARDAFSIGRQGIVGIDLAIAAADEEALRTLTRGDTDGVVRGELLAAGRAFLVTYGTGVEILERGPAAFRVRVLDGPRSGRDGWLPRDQVREPDRRP